MHIYEITKVGSVINRIELLRKFKVKNYSRAEEALRKYVRREGTTSIWNSKKPSLEMAREFNEIATEISRKQVNKIKECVKPNVLINEQYKKEIKIFGLTIYSKTINKLP